MSEADSPEEKTWLNKLGCVTAVAAPVGVAALIILALLINSGEEVPGENDAGASPSPVVSSAPAVASCEDATTAFRASGGSEIVQRVCWEPTGQLRAEAGLSIDAEPGSPLMRAMCTALSTFATGSGKEWKGFTVYSTHQLSPGRAILTSSQPGQCARPS